jgi:molybdate transport system substrate-binding protein
VLLLSATFILFATPPVGRAQTPSPLIVLASNGIRAAMEQLRSDAERAIGRGISVKYSSSTALRQAIDQGEAFDLAILTPEIIETLVKTGRIRPGTATEVARVDLAVGMRAGARRDDIGTPDAMKRRLLAARSLTWTEGGASAGPVEDMLRALGIAEQLRPRIVLQRVPGIAADTVAHGDNELVFAPRSEIQNVAGVEVLGLFPKEFQRPVVMTAGVGARAHDENGAAHLIRFLTSPGAASALKATGMTPIRAR